jgi:hypothetical protein
MIITMKGVFPGNRLPVFSVDAKESVLPGADERSHIRGFGLSGTFY